MAKKYPKLGKILKRLLFDKDMKAADLSREVDIPQPTIHRLITGKSTRPYKSSLKPIADYFSVTVDQLLGEEPLYANNQSNHEKDIRSIATSEIQNIPLMPWDKLANHNTNGDYEHIPFIGNISSKSFATIMPDSSMEPIFSQGSVLIFDPDKTPKDRSYVLAQFLENKTSVFRQLLIDADNKYLKSLNSDLHEHQIRLLDSTDNIIATLVESRTCFEPNIRSEN